MFNILARWSPWCQRCHFCGYSLTNDGSNLCSNDSCGMYNGFSVDGSYDNGQPKALADPDYNRQRSRAVRAGNSWRPAGEEGGRPLCEQCEARQLLKIHALSLLESVERSHCSEVESRYDICEDCKTRVDRAVKRCNFYVKHAATRLRVLDSALDLGDEIFRRGSNYRIALSFSFIIAVALIAVFFVAACSLSNHYLTLQFDPQSLAVCGQSVGMLSSSGLLSIVSNYEAPVVFILAALAVMAKPLHIQPLKLCATIPMLIDVLLTAATAVYSRVASFLPRIFSQATSKVCFDLKGDVNICSLRIWLFCIRFSYATLLLLSFVWTMGFSIRPSSKVNSERSSKANNFAKKTFDRQPYCAIEIASFNSQDYVWQAPRLAKDYIVPPEQTGGAAIAAPRLRLEVASLADRIDAYSASRPFDDDMEKMLAGFSISTRTRDPSPPCCPPDSSATTTLLKTSLVFLVLSMLMPSSMLNSYGQIAYALISAMISAFWIYCTILRLHERRKGSRYAITSLAFIILSLRGVWFLVTNSNDSRAKEILVASVDVVIKMSIKMIVEHPLEVGTLFVVGAMLLKV